MDWKEELLREESFLEIYIVSRNLTGSKFNKWAVFITFIFLATILFADIIVGSSIYGTALLIQWIRGWANLGISFTTSILGFLIAGFSIFSTVTKKDLFVALAHLPYKESGISRLKFVFFNFIIVFIHYLGFLGMCLIIMLLLPENGLLTQIIAALTKSYPLLQRYLAAMLVVVIGTWMMAIVLMLKSFIWNLYQAVLLSIVTEAEIEERNKRRQS